MKSVAVAFVAVVLAGAAFAQNHPGPITTGSGNPLASSTWMAGQLFIDKETGAVSTFVDTTQAPRPMAMTSIAYDIDNRSIVFGTGANQGNYQLLKGIYRRDATTGRYTTIIKSDDLWWVWNLMPNSDNDLIVGAGATYEKLFKVSMTGGLTTLTPGGLWGVRPEPSLDVATGNILVRTYSWDLKSYLVLAVSVHDSWDLYYRSASPLDGLKMTERLDDGFFYYTSQGAIFKWRRGMSSPTQVAKVPVIGPEQVVDFVFDNQTAAQPRALVLTSATNPFPYPPYPLYGQRLLHLDPANNFAVTRYVDVVKFSASPVPQPYAAEVYNHQSRYVCSQKTAPGKWKLHFNFPSRPGKRYLAVAGHSGVRPGLKLGDGRRIWLNYDALFALTLANNIGWAWNPGPGVLDAGGSASGHLDLSGLPLPLNVTIHIVAAVLDPSAPFGIAFLTEPHPMQL